MLLYPATHSVESRRFHVVVCCSACTLIGYLHQSSAIQNTNTTTNHRRYVLQCSSRLFCSPQVATLGGLFLPVKWTGKINERRLNRYSPLYQVITGYAQIFFFFEFSMTCWPASWLSGWFTHSATQVTIKNLFFFFFFANCWVSSRAEICY